MMVEQLQLEQLCIGNIEPLAEERPQYCTISKKRLVIRQKTIFPSMVYDLMVDSLIRALWQQVRYLFGASCLYPL